MRRDLGHAQAGGPEPGGDPEPEVQPEGDAERWAAEYVQPQRLLQHVPLTRHPQRSRHHHAQVTFFIIEIYVHKNVHIFCNGY